MKTVENYEVGVDFRTISDNTKSASETENIEDYRRKRE
jgi:hypothetical protein